MDSALFQSQLLRCIYILKIIILILVVYPNSDGRTMYAFQKDFAQVISYPDWAYSASPNYFALYLLARRGRQFAEF